MANLSLENESFGQVPRMWEPTEERGEVMKKFWNNIEMKYHIKFKNYWDFHQWSISNITEFWTEIWDFSEIICSKRFQQVVDLSVPMEKSPRWFEGAKLNFAENLLKHRDEHTALITTGEDRETKTVSYKQLYEESCIYAAAFRKLGVKKGDIIASYMTNIKEAILAMLGVTSIGAFWTSVLPVMGSQAVLNRLYQVRPKMLITVDRFVYNKEEFPLTENIRKISEGLPTLEKTIIVRLKESSKLKDITGIKNSCFLEDFLATGGDEDGSVPPMKFEQVSVSHPIFISFTSGTTGLPKPLVHGSGIIISAARSYGIQCNITRDSVLLSSSPPGWCSWNMFTTLLSLGVSLVLFDGHPYFLSPTFLWDIVEQFNVSLLFFSTSILEELEKRKFLPTEKHSLKSIKAVMAGGSIVKPSTFDFMYKLLNGKAPFASDYGSTELMDSPFCMEQTLPVYRGELNAITLGYDIRCLNDDGEPVIGETGELVIAKPVPNLPLGIWGFSNSSILKQKYFLKFPSKFSLGDHGYFNPVTKGLVICGRSDATLKQRGCRFGSSEIYNVVERFPEIMDSICVSVYNKRNDERAALFLKMRKGYAFNDDLINRIREAITKELTVRHVPDVITKVDDIPYNANGKKLESLVKDVINNRTYHLEVASNPDSIKCYIGKQYLQEF